MIPEEGTPGAAAEHEGLHKRSFGLDSVIQIVSRPRMKELCQGDRTKLWMLDSPFQILILHLLNQDKTFLAMLCKRSRKLFRRLSSKIWMRLIGIEIAEVLARQKSAEAHRKERTFRIHQML